MVFSALFVVFIYLCIRGFTHHQKSASHVCFSSGEFRTSLLVAAHPSWSLVKSRPERRSHVTSALCAHQIPRGGSMPCLAPLRLKGRTGTTSMSSSTTPSGASGSKAQSVLAPSTSTSEGATFHRVTPSALSSSFVGSMYEAIRCPLAPPLRASSPSFAVYFFFVDIPCTLGVCFLGQTDVFPVCAPARLRPSFPVRLRSWLLVPPGAIVFPGRDCVQVQGSHLQGFPCAS